MAFELPPLPYAQDALAPHMSAETLEYHHGKHHKAYVDNLNKMIGEKGVFNNAGQIWNHSFFWQCLTPDSQGPTGKLKDMIDETFGGHEKLIEKLKTESVGHFGSGWGWLILNNGNLEVTSLHDGDSPIAHGMTPLLTVDVWEHAYYIDYRNQRPVFVDTVLNNLINWEFVAQNLDGQGVSRADQQG